MYTIEGIMKKNIFLLLLTVLLFSFIGSAAQDVVTIGDWDAVENNTGWTLNVYRGDAAELKIPAELEGKPVTQLGKEVFKNNFKLESVIVPDSITAIGNGAFFGCSALKNVKLPNALRTIGANTFQYCISLEQIDIPFSVTSIGVSAFADCIRLGEIVLLSVTSIGDSAFDDCPMLSSVTVTRKLTTLGTHVFRDSAWLDAQTDEFVFVGKGILIKWNGSGSDVEIPLGTTAIYDAFEEQYSLESVKLPETVTVIGSNTFRDAVNLRSVNIPAHTTTIGGSAFENCRSLEKIDLPDDVRSIGGSAFRNCQSLKEFTFPPQVTTIPALVLGDCRELTDVIIPKAVTKIDARSFEGCGKIVLNVPKNSDAEQILIERGTEYTYSLQKTAGFVYSAEENGIRILRYTGNVYDVEIPAVIDGMPVISVETAAFQNNANIRSVVVPLTVKTIGDWAFSYMDSLESVQLPAALTGLGSNVFTGSPALKEIRMPESLRNIGSEPLDTGTQTVICAAENSEIAGMLSGMGYEVRPADECADDPETAVLWAELKKLGILTSESDCDCDGPVKESNEGRIVRIPDGVTELTAALLGDIPGNLLLVVPSDVTQIEEQILTDRNVTIIGESGSAAEAFAKEHGLKFLIIIDTWLSAL